jgi:RNA polymerase sigma factor (sigma-70 family)
VPERPSPARIQPHMAHVPGHDGKRRELDLSAETVPADWSELVALHEPWMRALVSGRIPAHLKARFDGDDVVQSAFLTLCERIESGQASVEGDIKGFLYRIVRNGLCDEVRRHTRRRRSAGEECHVSEHALDLHECPCEMPLEAIERAESQTTLIDAIARLSALDRRLVQLKHIEQRSWIEIGRLLEMPESTARRKGLEAFGRLMRLVD